MAGSVNKVILVGNLGRDPETRRLGSGDPVVNLRLATSETFKDREGNRQERTEWHSVAIFNERLGEVAEGVNTLKVLKHKAEELQVYMPLVAGLHAILFEGRTLDQIIGVLMRGEPKTDVDFISTDGF